MIRLHSWVDLPQTCRGASLALGNFDGVHKGHQTVIADAARAARALGCPLGVVSFDPHPRRFFQPDLPPFRLMTLDQQTRALADLGVDLFYVLPFDASMAALSDEAFAQTILSEGLGARHVAVGFDITYGKGRSGSPQSLQAQGQTLGFGVSVTPECRSQNGIKYASSAIRTALENGDPVSAAQAMGRPFAIEGVVSHGVKRGRTLGFPTLNIALGDYQRPRFGVYATRTTLADGRAIPGVANLGQRPSVEGTEARLEVHLFDVNEDLYGQTVETQLLTFIRPEQRFEGLDALKAQITKDSATARDLLLPPL
ncbi:MAG: bifunctional riboflavin kinase/FAD synthetase [Asticcacaulis sp.]